MEKCTTLLIPAYLSGFFAVCLLALWPLIQDGLILNDILSMLSLAVLIITGAFCGILTIFLARASCYLFIEAPTSHRDQNRH